MAEAVTSRVEPAATRGLDRRRRRLGGGVVADERGRDGHGGPPPRVGQRVDHAHLEPAARPHGREQRREVVRDVVEGREAELVAVLDPVRQTQPVEDRDELGLVAADEHHPRRQRIVGPRARGVGAVAVGGDGPALVDLGPDGEAPRPPPARRAPGEGRVRERGGEQRAGVVGAVPAPLGIGGRRAEVDVHLDGGRRAHHRATRRALRVEVRLHRVVARRVDATRPGWTRVEAQADQPDAAIAELGGERGGVGRNRRARGADAAQGRRAELDLPSGLEGEAAAGGELGARLTHQLGEDRLGRVGEAQRQPLDLDADPPGSGGEEALLVDQAADVARGEGPAGGGHGYRYP